MSTSSLPDQLAQAHLMVARLNGRIPPTALQRMTARLTAWQQRYQQSARTTTALPPLVVRPGLPPQPLDARFFVLDHHELRRDHI